MAEIQGISARGRGQRRGRDRSAEREIIFFEENPLTLEMRKVRILFSTTIFPRRFQNSKKI